MESIFKTPSDGHYFFGYYDKSPFDFNNQKLLAMKAEFMDRMPFKDDILKIGYFDWQNNSDFIKLTETKAWNWQQGCMLQWVGPDFNKQIIFNDRIDNKFVSIIMNIKTRVETVLPMAVYTVRADGKYALCIDNERHFWFRCGYNYQGIENVTKRNKLDKKDGIWLLDIKRKRVKQVINIVDLITINPLSNMEGATHYLEHLMFSPSGKRFCFLHRWRIDDGAIYARFFTANIDGSDIYLLNDSGRMSHFCWKNENELLAWCGLPTKINQLRKYKNIVKYFIRPFLPLYHKLIQTNSNINQMITGDNYILFKDKSDLITKIGTKILYEDGHPTFCPSIKNWFVSDTYQDDRWHRHLFLFNTTTGEKVDVAQLKSDPDLDNSSFRCDLHPKWSHDGRYVSVDTVNEGFRQVYVYDVNEIMNRVCCE